MTDDFRDSGVHEFKREIPKEEEEIVVSSEDEVIPEEVVVPRGFLPGEEVIPEEDPADNVEGQDNQPLPEANQNPDPALTTHHQEEDFPFVSWQASTANII